VPNIRLRRQPGRQPGRQPRRKPRTPLKTTLTAVAAALLAGTTAVACASGGGANTITLYSGQHEQTTQLLVAAFEKQTGITVNVRSGDEGSLAAQIQQEGSASPADVFLAENSPALATLDEHGLLGPADPAAEANVAARYRTADWVGVSARVSGVVVHRGVTPPTSVLDLALPPWKGKIGLAPSETDFQPVVAAIAKLRGQNAAENWLKALKANAGGNVYPDNETLTANVDKGTVDVGIIDHYYWYRLEQETKTTNSSFAFFAPQDPGYALIVSGAAVLKSSKHQAAARQFQNFLTTAAAQRVIATSFSYEYPIDSGVAANPALPPFGQLQPAPLTVIDFGDGSVAINLLREAQLA
jgi:iron(III) transport system substrate-binding protein